MQKWFQVAAKEEEVAAGQATVVIDPANLAEKMKRLCSEELLKWKDLEKQMESKRRQV